MQIAFQHGLAAIIPSAIYPGCPLTVQQKETSLKQVDYDRRFLISCLRYLGSSDFGGAYDSRFQIIGLLSMVYILNQLS